MRTDVDLRLSHLVDLDRRAVQHSVELAGGVTVDQLALPTPCTGWNLGDLLTHMIAQHRGFAAAASGNDSDRSVWEWQPIGDDPAAAYAAASRLVSEAFSRSTLSHTFWLPEILEVDGGPFTARTGISFHLLDYVVHGWDVAAALGIPADLPADLVHAARAIGQLVPRGSARTRPGAAFGPVLEDTRAGSELDDLLLLLGRSPSWPE